MSLFGELKRRNVFRVGIAYGVLGWVLLQVTDVVVPILSLPDWVARLVLFLLALGLPLVLFFAWAFELTPDGLKREKDVDRSESITPHTGRRLDRTIIVVLLLALGWFTWDRFGSGPGTPEPVSVSNPPVQPEVAESATDELPVIAVLPFKASGSDDGGFLASGLHDDLLTRLAKLGAFRVISRTSMMEYAGTAKNMRLIGEELGAGYILEGGVQAMGDRVRINAQLIHAPVDEHIWAEVYNRDLTTSDLFDVQAELAVAIAEALQTELSPSDLALVAEVPTQDMAAYNAYLRGLEVYESTGYINTDRDRRARAAFEEAVQLDPEFALAWAGLATARIRADCCEYGAEQSASVMQALERSEVLQPGLLESGMARAEYLYRFERDYRQALAVLDGLGERAAGNVYVTQMKAWLNRRLGRFQEAYDILLRARRLQPRSASVSRDLVMHAWLLPDCDRAAVHLQELLQLAAEEPASRVRRAEFELECTGDADKAVELIEGLDFQAIGGYQSGFSAAWKARNLRMYFSINDGMLQYPGPATPFWYELNLAAAYRFLAPDAERTGQALGRAAEQLAAYAQDADRAASEMYAAMQCNYHGMQGATAETLEWVAEHKRRFHTEFKGDLAEEANNRLSYAWALAIAGLDDEAVAELREMLESPGGHSFLYFDDAPIFDRLEGHPGYVELEARYGKP